MKNTTFMTAISLFSLTFLSASALLTIPMSYAADAAQPVEGKLYRHVDANGNVHYSDQPSAGAEEIKLEKVPSISIEQPKIDFETLEEQQEKKRDPNAPYYQVFSFTSPEQDGVIRNNGAVVSMAVSLTPSLSRGHYIKFYIDSKLVADKQKVASFQAKEVEYGPHTASFVVYNDNGSKVQGSDTINFSLLHVVRKPNKSKGAMATMATMPSMAIETGFPAHPKAPTYNSMKKTAKPF